MTITHNSKRGRWVYDFRFAGKRYQGYAVNPATGKHAASRKEAECIERGIRTRLEEGHKIVSVAPGTYTLAQAIVAMLTQSARQKDFDSKKRIAGKILGYFGGQTPVTAIAEDRLWDFVAHMRTTPITVFTGGPHRLDCMPDEDDFKTTARTRSDATINRYLSILRRILNIAHNITDPITGLSSLPVVPRMPVLREVTHDPNPVDFDIVTKMYALANDRTAWRDGLDRSYLADAILLGALTGYRRANLFGLTLDDYIPHLRALRVRGEDTKGNRDDIMHLNDVARAIVERRIEAARQHGMFRLFFRVIKRRDKTTCAMPVDNPKRAYRSLAKRLGVKHRFHDLKATFLTSVGQINPLAVSELGRHKSPSTTKRYLKLIDQGRQDAVDGLSRFMPGISVGEDGSIIVQKTESSLTKITNKENNETKG